MSSPQRTDLSPVAPGDADPPSDGGAYLVLQAAGRWSDVFRLTAPGEAFIGRGSSNQIVVRSDQASRRHARIWRRADGWVVEDLDSRNGTRVNGQLITQPQHLEDGDRIEIAGFAIQFARRVQSALTRQAPDPLGKEAGQASDDQITMEIDPGSITDRRRQSDHLHRAPAETSGALLQLAFTLARAETLSAAAEPVLDALTETVKFETAGLYVRQPRPGAGHGPAAMVDQLQLAATRQRGDRSYHRPPATMLESIAAADGQAILARNVAGDRQLVRPDSRDQLAVESVIIAPVRDPQHEFRGAIHLTTAGGQTPLDSADLEFVVAAAEILGQAIAQLFDRHRLSQSVRQLKRSERQLRAQLADQWQIVGNSPAIQQVIEQIGLVAPTDSTVLVRGESGVGKELVAAAIHHASERREAPLVCLNCAALSPMLLESELFGHEKGAFTGATERKPGKFELADGGTLLLDEIGEMSAELQAKFLRVLEGHPFERVGGHQAIQSDVRVVAATNRDLQAMVAEGQFRADLFYRLNVVEILVPPLRDRGHDCLQLAEFFLRRFNREMGRQLTGFSQAAQQRLLGYPWPGNVRELKNVIERAVVWNSRGQIEAAHLVLAPAAVPSAGPAGTSEAPLVSLAKLERQHIQQVLRHTDGNKSRAAAILGIERSTLDRKLKKWTGKR